MVDWNKEFAIAASISRKTLKELGFLDEQIAQVSDDEMNWIAQIMAQNYQASLYTEDLRHLTHLVLRDKEKSHD